MAVIQERQHDGTRQYGSTRPTKQAQHKNNQNTASPHATGFHFSLASVTVEQLYTS